MKNFLIGTVIGAVVAYAGHRLVMGQLDAIDAFNKTVPKDS